ncbi:DEP domain-containing protein 1B-like [Styela clava]|uniref:DEP domain-containing protein 1B-like n=1 Tax=Styela clava TaxID=7725 RepID=UPI0019396B3B|nr:DEP domain-containing protein 1B-like [Styela clava]
MEPNVSTSSFFNDCRGTSLRGSKRYKATTIWNELLNAFRDRLNCKKHRRNLKTYDNCFTGSGAADVMHSVLLENENVSQDVTRSQAIKLLQKFLFEHVIETINGKWENELFTDTNRLYRLYGENEDTEISSSSIPLIKNKFPSRQIILSPPISRRFATSPKQEKPTRSNCSMKLLPSKGCELRFIPKCLLAVVD